MRTDISVFQTDTGRFVRRFSRPPGFSNRGETVIVDRAGLALQTSGVWPSNMAGNWLARGTDRVHEGSRFGLALDLSLGVAKPLFNPVAPGCGSPSATCWESAFDRIGGAQGGWVFAQRQSPVVAVVSPQGAVVRTIRVESVHFRRDGRTVDASAPLENQLAWNETNSEIARVFVVGDRLAVVHVISTTRGWRPGTWIQWAAYLNLYTLDGTIVESDIPLPGLPVGRDDEELFVVDYGSQERRAGVPARLVAIGVGR